MLKHLLDLTVRTDEARPVIEAAGAMLGHQIALVDAGGAVLGCAPDGAAGERALAVARSAARTRVVAPPGWKIIPIGQDGAPLAILVVGAEGPDDAETRWLLDLLPTMLAGQLRRSVLARLQRAAFVRRLVSGPPLAPHDARHEAAELGMALQDAYWPAILGSQSRALPPGVIERIEHEVHARVAGSLTTVRSGRLVLLHPAGSVEAHPTPAAWFHRAAEHARSLAPSARPQVVAAEHAVEVGALSACVGLLETLQRFPPRAAGDAPVAWTREYALDRLLRSAVDPERAASFVEHELGSLIRRDRESGGDLLRVLEAALDFPRHDEAARRCFMHRNTFRHRLRVALAVLGTDLESPDVRLAVHVALKLRHLMASAACAGPPAEAGPTSVGAGERGRRLRAPRQHA